jgi:hypothetical protein
LVLRRLDLAATDSASIADLTRQAIRQGTFENVRVLTAAIERFTRQWNAGAGPFSWVKTADEILAKAVRKTQADSGARH